MKMPKRNNNKKGLKSYSKPKITPKMKEKIKKMGRRKKVMTPMKKGY
jgi:hypothetical protein